MVFKKMEKGQRIFLKVVKNYTVHQKPTVHRKIYLTTMGVCLTSMMEVRQLLDLYSVYNKALNYFKINFNQSKKVTLQISKYRHEIGFKDLKLFNFLTLI